MKISTVAVALLLVSVSAQRVLKGKKDKKPELDEKKPELDGNLPKETGKSCKKSDKSGHYGKDNSERMLLREGVIDALPSSLCGNEGAKNVILVIGDGMGWEMVRAGAIAKRVLDELKDMGVDTKNGSTGTAADAAKEAFAGRTLSDYYTEGKGSGLSFQDHLDNFALMTTTTTVIQAPNPGNHYAPSNSMLNGSVADHDNGMAPLALDECGYPIDFDPSDYAEDGGNMVLWSNEKGGEFPWDPRYFQENPDTSDGFDPTYIMQHATDSASTAGTMATGHKSAVNMMSVDLYEEDVSTLVEDAMMCGKAGGVVSTVPVLHATPGAFVTHSNNRRNGRQLQSSFRDVNPTLASGTCASNTQPSEEHKAAMMDGALKSEWTFLYQKEGVTAENFYNGIANLDPDGGARVMVCLAGDYTKSGESNLPFRGVDSSYSNRWCSNATSVVDPDDGETVIGYTPNSEKCDHYSKEEMAQIPHIATNVEEAIKFLSKDDDGFFLMYEQGDIDWAAHDNHMDDLLGTMLDISDTVQKIIDWIQENGGYEKTALYVTADHDHYLTLNDDFPEILANLLIDGESHNITPQNNSKVNPWEQAILAGRHEDDSKSQVEHINDFSTWTEEDIKNVGHFWGAPGSGGNGWGSHSTRHVPLFYMGDNGCIEAFTGKGFQVLGRDVQGIEGKIDQMHLHACMLKNLFGL